MLKEQIKINLEINAYNEISIIYLVNKLKILGFDI